jgi:hypothetical protein
MLAGAGGTVRDCVEATEVLHSADSADLHFRFIGTAKDRQFVINVQFASADETTGIRLRPEECDFLIVKILALVNSQIAERPNPGLH